MKLLITGGLGYLGGRLSQYLEERSEYEIIIGSRRKVNRPSWLSRASIAETSWNSQAQLEQICTGVNQIVHLAGMNSQDCLEDPVAALEVNAVATARLVEAAIRQGVRRFIYFSTAHVYSSPLTGVINEETKPISLHPYATTHRAAEEVVRSANLHGKIEGIVVRLSNAYGVPSSKVANCWQLLINDLCRQAITTKKMVLKSSGVQRRDFIAIKDVCEATNYLINSKHVKHDIFNMGGNWSPTILEVAHLIQARCVAVLGFEPQLITQISSLKENAADLIYQTELLTQIGFKLTAEKWGEIDELLLFCKVNFG